MSATIPAGPGPGPGLDRVPLRLYVDRLVLEGVAELLGPVTAEALAEEIGDELARMVRAHGVPPLAPGGALRLDGATVRLAPGVTRHGLAPAIASQLFAEIYGPVIDHGRPSGAGLEEDWT